MDYDKPIMEKNTKSTHATLDWSTTIYDVINQKSNPP